MIYSTEWLLGSFNDSGDISTEHGAVNTTGNGPIGMYLFHHVLLPSHIAIVVDGINFAIGCCFTRARYAALALDLWCTGMAIGVSLREVRLAWSVRDVVFLYPPECRLWLSLYYLQYLRPYTQSQIGRKIRGPVSIFTDRGMHLSFLFSYASWIHQPLRMPTRYCTGMDSSGCAPMGRMMCRCNYPSRTGQAADSWWSKRERGVKAHG